MVRSGYGCGARQCICRPARPQSAHASTEPLTWVVGGGWWVVGGG